MCITLFYRNVYIVHMAILIKRETDNVGWQTTYIAVAKSAASKHRIYHQEYNLCLDLKCYTHMYSWRFFQLSALNLLKAVAHNTRLVLTKTIWPTQCYNKRFLNAPKCISQIHVILISSLCPLELPRIYLGLTANTRIEWIWYGISCLRCCLMLEDQQIGGMQARIDSVQQTHIT